MIKRMILMSVVAMLCIAASAQDKEKKGDPQGSSNLKISIVKATNGKPIRNASVILHPVNKDGRQSKGGLNLKTDSDGKTGFDAAPYGKLRIQVIARGFQTYGEDFDIDQPEQEIVIKMKPPAQQYSIYGETGKESTPNKQQ